MADQLATPQELASFLQLGDYSTLTPAKQQTLTMLTELATAKVQRAAGGQRIILAESTAVIDLPAGYDDCYVPLPQWPVRSVAAVSLNGGVITNFYLRSHALWRAERWGCWSRVPPQIGVTYTHGHAAGSQSLVLARTAVLELARGGWGNPLGMTSKAIDDYRVTYAEADARMVLPRPTIDSLAQAYGRSAHVTVLR
jgi:hypothetical protein